MKTVQIQELKRKLSALVEAAAAGEQILITRHNRPFATLGPPPQEGLHRGAGFGRTRLEPLAGLVSTAPIARTLAEDRGDDR